MKFSNNNGLKSVFLILFLFLGYQTIISQNQDSSPRETATAKLESEDLLMGNLLKLTISVPVESDTVKVMFPLLQQAIQNKRSYVELLNDTVELLTAHTASYIPEGSRHYYEYQLHIQAFDSGKYVLPPFELMVGNQKISTNSLTLNVLPVKVKADDQIDNFSDIAQPFDVNPNPEELEEETSSLIWWLIACAILLLGLIIYLLIRYRKTGRILPLSKPIPIYQQALNKLRKLSQQNLPEKGKTKEYYTRLSDILRNYLYRQFKVRTYERTTSEILKDIEETQEISQYTDIVKSILETSDFVKFAKVNPSTVENNRCMQEAVRFIEASHPLEEIKKEGGKK